MTTSPSYRNTQKGWVIIAAVVVGLLVGGLPLVRVARSPAIWIVAPVFLFLAAVGWVFSELETEVVDGRLRKAFRPGWPSREEDLERIREVRIVKNPWYYGWGIRITPHGWLWNVSGTRAVELLRHDGSRFRVGTDDPEGLRDALEGELRTLRRRRGQHHHRRR